MFKSKVFSLNVALNVVVGTRDDCGLDHSSLKFLKVDVLGRLGHHLEHTKELLLFKLNYLFKLSRP